MPDRRGSLSVTRLFGLQLTPGKLRGLQRICNDNGTLTMVATDQNSSMISMMKDANKKKGEMNPKNVEEGRDPLFIRSRVCPHRLGDLRHAKRRHRLSL